MKPLIFNEVSQEKTDAMVKALSSHGSTVQSQGAGIYRITGHGVKASATLSSDGTLTVTIQSKPFYIPESAIENGIDEALHSA